jgi:hypothetical protein
VGAEGVSYWIAAMNTFSFLNVCDVKRFVVPAGAGLLLAGAVVPASAANIFEALFGSTPVPATAPRTVYPAQSSFRELTIRIPPVRSPAQVKKKAGKKPVTTFAVVNPVQGMGINSAFRPVIAKARPPVLPGPLGPFLMDSTLSRGDVVVTTAGLRIFAGGYSSRHSPSVFLPLSKAQSYAQGRMSLLAAIEENNRRGEPQITYRQFAAPAYALPGFVVLKSSSEHALLRPVGANSAAALREPVTVSR